MTRAFYGRRSSANHVASTARPRCQHGCCFDFAKEGEKYCEFHAPLHVAVVKPEYKSSITAIPKDWLMAGSARVRCHIERLPDVEAVA